MPSEKQASRITVRLAAGMARIAVLSSSAPISLISEVFSASVGSNTECISVARVPSQAKYNTKFSFVFISVRAWRNAAMMPRLVAVALVNIVVWKP